MKRWIVPVLIPFFALRASVCAGGGATDAVHHNNEDAPRVERDSSRTDKPAFTVLGVYTTLRFNRGEFFGYMPIVGDDFFARERLSLRKMLTRFYAFAFKYERIYSVVDPESFDSDSDTIYHDIFNVYDPKPGANRFNLDAVKKHAGELNVRYVLLGDVTKLDIKSDSRRGINDITAEASFYIYDSATSAITFQKTFSAAVRGNDPPLEEFNADETDGDDMFNQFSSNDMGHVFVKISDQLVEAVRKWRDKGEPVMEPIAAPDVKKK